MGTGGGRAWDLVAGMMGTFVPKFVITSAAAITLLA